MMMQSIGKRRMCCRCNMISNVRLAWLFISILANSVNHFSFFNSRVHLYRVTVCDSETASRRIQAGDTGGMPWWTTVFQNRVSSTEDGKLTYSFRIVFVSLTVWNTGGLALLIKKAIQLFSWFTALAPPLFYFYFLGLVLGIFYPAA